MLIRCYECKKKISDECKSCPNCGCELTEGKKAEFVKKEKRLKRIIASIFISLTFVVATFLVVMSFQKKEEKIKEQERKENIKLAIEETNIHKKYISATAELLESADAFCNKVAELNNLILSVWYNAEYNIRDEKTDKYTFCDDIISYGFLSSSSAVSNCIDEQTSKTDFIQLKENYSNCVKSYKKSPIHEKDYSKYWEFDEWIKEYVEEIDSYYEMTIDSEYEYSDYCDTSLLFLERINELIENKNCDLEYEILQEYDEKNNVEE